LLLSNFLMREIFGIMSSLVMHMISLINQLNNILKI